MSSTLLLDLAKAGDFEAFEGRCVEQLGSGTLTLAEMLEPLRQFEPAKSPRIAPLVQMIIENSDTAAHPAAALALVRVALNVAPDNAALRAAVVKLYEQVYGDETGFASSLTTAGLAGGRPIRTAMKIMDLCMTLQPGHTLISRADDRVHEVTEVDREKGLFTLKRDARVSILPADQLAREFDRIDPADFRAMRQLRAAKLNDLIESDPVMVVVGILHSHGEMLTLDVLKAELVPRYVQAAEWTRWWTKARTALKRSPNVTLEGRSPIVLTYTAKGLSVEDEAWDAFVAEGEPHKQLAVFEGYAREKTERGEPLDETLFDRCHHHMQKHIDTVKQRRPSDALATAMILESIFRKAGRGDGGAPAVEMLRSAADPAGLIAGLPEALWDRGLETLKVARPDGWLDHALALLPRSSSPLIDQIVTAAAAAGRAAEAQTFVDAALADMPSYPEAVHWLWKGPRSASALKLPTLPMLFGQILEHLSSLGRSVAAEAAKVKEFRARVKAALALKDYANVREVFRQISEASAITVRRHLERLEGLGDNARVRMIDLLREVHPWMWVERKKRVAAWEEEDTIWTTREGLRRRTAERDDIENVQMRDNARRIGEAASLGDLSENSEYKFALEERDLLRARLARVNSELGQARIIERGDVPADTVGVGSRVTLRDSRGRTREVVFLGPFDSDLDRGIISYMAPISMKIMGASVGERVKMAFDGDEQEYEILAVACGID